MPMWLRIRRLRGPAFLILVGITALLHQWHVLRFARSWPLYLILAGLFGLAERAALSSAPFASVPPLGGPYVPDAGFGAYGSSAPGPAYGAPALSSGTDITGTSPDAGGRR